VEYGQFSVQTVKVDHALAARKDELTNVKIRGITRAAGVPEVVKADPTATHFIYNNLHFSGIDRKMHDQGLCWFVPINYHEVPGYYRRFMELDVAIMVVTSMDEHGYFNFSTSCSHARAICDAAKMIIVEVNPNCPRCLGGYEEAIHISEVDYIVDACWSMPQLPAAPPSEVDQKIASLIMNEIQDGSCIQLGIGGMPNAVGMMIAQSDLKDLGVHTEMFVDSMVEMYEAGRLTGAKKNLDRNKIVFTFAMGTQKAYDFLHNNPACATYPVNYTNDPCVVRQIDNFIAINNCVEVDLYGQVCSESAGPRQISGTGGQADFTIGAYESKGGKAFICMTSSYGKGDQLKSRINKLLAPGAIVTIPRSMVSYLVTEYGMVNLKGKSTWERAEAIISIAHPNFRDELVKDAEELGIWRRSSKIR
jgi:butyryl-CoA:acetate CoA-transferase